MSTISRKSKFAANKFVMPKRNTTQEDDKDADDANIDPHKLIPHTKKADPRPNHCPTTNNPRQQPAEPTGGATTIENEKNISQSTWNLKLKTLMQ